MDVSLRVRLAATVLAGRQGCRRSRGLAEADRNDRDPVGRLVGGSGLERGVHAASASVSPVHPVFAGAIERRELKRHECRAPWLWG